MRYRNALNALGLGAVEILQDAAVALPPPNPSAPIDSIEHPDHPARPENGGRGGMHHGGGHRFVGGQAMWHGQGVTHYHEPEYRHSDDCHLGCANQQPTGTTVPLDWFGTDPRRAHEPVQARGMRYPLVSERWLVHRAGDHWPIQRD